MRIALLAVVAQLAFAAGPVITDLQPRGAERGRPFTLIVSGRGLSDGARIQSTLPATFTPLGLPQKGPMMTPGRYAQFLVEPKADTPVGTYPIRIETPEGISNVLMFTVGSFPETAEEESQPGAPENSNDSIESAQPVRNGQVTLNGTLRGPERDVYRVSAKAGERRVFEVEARRSGSAVDAVLRILDASGRQLARNEDAPGIGLDARIDFTFPREGNYYVEVTDARFSRQTQNFYRLKMGAFPYAEDVFPLGGKRGESVDVTFSGAGVSKPVAVSVDLKQAPAKTDTTWVNLPDSPGLPLPFALSDFPEVREPQSAALALPVVINGKLGAEGEADLFKLKVRAGQRVMLETQARDLGTSKIMAFLSVRDQNGKLIATAGSEKLYESPTSVGQSLQARDPFVSVKVPEGVNELAVSIEDLARRGGAGYSYRLIAREQGEDFNVTIVTPQVNVPDGGTVPVIVNVDRRGYDGPVELKVANLPVDMFSEGGFVPAEGERTSGGSKFFSRRGTILLTAKPGARVNAAELEVWAEAKLDNGAVIRRKARGIGMQVPVAGATQQGVVDRQRNLAAPQFGFDLPVATTERLPASLEVAQVERKREAEGDRYVFRWKWNLRAKQRTPDDVNVEIPGINDIRIIDVQRDPADPLAGTFVVTTTKATLPSRYDVYVSGRLGDDPAGEEIYSRPVEILVEEIKESKSEAGSN